MNTPKATFPQTDQCSTHSALVVSSASDSEVLILTSGILAKLRDALVIEVETRFAMP